MNTGQELTYTRPHQRKVGGRGDREVWMNGGGW